MAKEKLNKEKSASGGKSSEKIAKLVEEISALSVLELSDLVNTLQEKLGVSAMPVPATPQATAVPIEAGGEAGAGAQATGASTQTVVMTASGANKIAVIKALRAINPNLGLKEAKDMTEQVPVDVLKDAKAEDAKSASEKLKAAGATVELK